MTIFSPWFVESMDVKFINMEDWLYDNWKGKVIVGGM